MSARGGIRIDWRRVELCLLLAVAGETWMIASMMNLARETTLLAIEAQTVIGIRLTQLALGRGSLAEIHLMMTEKMLAFGESAATVASGGSALKVVSGYRKRVRANVRRLR